MNIDNGICRATYSSTETCEYCGWAIDPEFDHLREVNDRGRIWYVCAECAKSIKADMEVVEDEDGNAGDQLDGDMAGVAPVADSDSVHADTFAKLSCPVTETFKPARYCDTENVCPFGGACEEGTR